jgi:hypothetical protein
MEHEGAIVNTLNSKVTLQMQNKSLFLKKMKEPALTKHNSLDFKTLIVI